MHKDSKSLDLKQNNLHKTLKVMQSKNTSQLKPDVLRIYFFTDELLSAQKLATKLEDHQYLVSVFTQVNHFVQQCELLPPSAILMDVAFDSEHFICSNMMKKVTSQLSTSPILIILSRYNNIKARLSAIRLNAAQYFVQPVSATTIIKYLDSLTNNDQLVAFKVLVVDHSEDMLLQHIELFKKNNINATFLSDPLMCLNALVEFQPDIIILDVIMPECSGLELAQVIRQNDKFAQIPIVFLTSEPYSELRFGYIALAGDDFFVKPVNPLHFVSAIISKIKRARQLIKLNNENYFQLAAMDKHNIVSSTDVHGIITSANEKTCEISGYKEHELLGKNHNTLKSDYHDESFFIKLWHTISKGTVWHGYICNKNSQGDEYWINSTIVPFLNDKNEPYKYVSVATDITEQKKIELALSQAKEEAEIANKTKSEFLSSMSHELRTPMNAIIGFSQLLKTDPSEPLTHPQQDSVNEILKAGQHLLELINEVLDLARIEAGRVNLSVETVIVAELLYESLQLIKPLAERRGITFFFNWNGVELPIEKLPYQLDAIQADRTRLKQVLLNLLSNAVKYNSERGKITINFHNNEEKSRLSFTDTGVGLSLKRQADLFKPFNRLGNEDSKEIEGTGIGLLITKNLVELMQGEIGLKSEPNKGCCFWIELPSAALTCIEKAMAAEALPVPDISTEAVKIEQSVLYIEDNPANLRLVTQVLQRISGIRLLSAPEPLLGLELAIEHKPDLILLDINLPGMNGFEALHHIKKMDSIRNVHVIAVSANAMPQDIEKGLAAGFDDYVTKPIDVMKLIEKVKCLLDIK